MSSEETSYRKRFVNFLDRYRTEKLVQGASSIAVFALVVSLIVYAVFSWADVFQIGMSQREQVLHIAVPIFVAVALFPMGASNFMRAIDIVDEVGEKEEE